MAYRVEESSLTAVADAIREKRGTSEGLTFPEGFVQAVAGIQAGGGGIATGLVSPTEDIDRTTGILITHNLGKIPRVAIVYRETQLDLIRDDTVASGELAFGYSINGTHSGVVYKYGSSITSSLSLATMTTISYKVSHAPTTAVTTQVIMDSNDKTAVLVPCANNSGVKFISGNTYRWIMIE